MPNEEEYYALDDHGTAKLPVIKVIGREAYAYKDGKWERREDLDYIPQEGSSIMAQIDEAKANELIGK